MTEQEAAVKREAQSLQEALEVFGPATSHTSKFQFVPSEQVRDQVERLDRLIQQPKATPEAKRELQNGLDLVERVARGLQSPPAYPFVRRQSRPLAEAAKLGRQLEAEVLVRREAIDRIS